MFWTAVIAFRWVNAETSHYIAVGVINALTVDRIGESVDGAVG